MSISNADILDLDRLKAVLGGKTSPDNSFIVREEHSWDKLALRKPYIADSAAFVYCATGEMELTIGVRKFRLRANTLMLYGPGNIVEIHRKTPDFTAGAMFFKKELIKNALLDLQAIMPIYKYLTEEANDFLLADDHEVGLIRKYFSLLSDVAGNFGETVISNLLASMLRAVSEMYARRMPAAETVRQRSRQEEYFERFMMEVSKYHKSHRSVKFYADALHITPKYLSTVIKEISGRSATDWIDEFVIQEAKLLLRRSTKSIQEITYHLNFSTQSFFGKYFKRHVGVSPSEYRSDNVPGD